MDQIKVRHSGYHRIEDVHIPGAGGTPVGTQQVALVSSTSTNSEYEADVLIQNGFELASMYSVGRGSGTTTVIAVHRVVTEDSISFEASLGRWGSAIVVLLEIDSPQPVSVVAGRSQGIATNGISPVEVTQGGYVAGLVTNSRRFVAEASGEQKLISSETSETSSGVNYALLVREVLPGEAMANIGPIAYTGRDSAEFFATLSLAFTVESGQTFQIKHNGALIPATPHLWSGGQLTPVALNLPE